MDSVEEKLLRNLSTSDLRELLAVLRKIAIRREKIGSPKAQEPIEMNPLYRFTVTLDDGWSHGHQHALSEELK